MFFPVVIVRSFSPGTGPTRANTSAVQIIPRSLRRHRRPERNEFYLLRGSPIIELKREIVSRANIIIVRRSLLRFQCRRNTYTRVCVCAFKFVDTWRA